MIKRALGAIVILAVLIVVVITALHRKNFQSMVLRDKIFDNTPGVVAPTAEPEVEAVEVTGDTLRATVVDQPDTAAARFVPDSLR